MHLQKVFQPEFYYKYFVLFVCKYLKNQMFLVIFLTHFNPRKYRAVEQND